jgi:hypothetical protein
MIRWADGSWHVRTRGRARKPITCDFCGDDRYILIREKE